MIWAIARKLSFVISKFQQNDHSDEALAGKSMFEFVSFRLSNISGSLFFMIFRQFKDVAKRLFQKPVYKYNANQSGVAILDAALRDEPIRAKFIKQFIGKDIELIFTKDKMLMQISFWISLKLLCFSIYLSVLVFFKFQKKGLKANWILLIKQIPEIVCLVYYLKRHKIQHFFDFENYQTDSNFLYLVLRDLNIKVYKFPSSGPLYMHNSILLSDYLLLSSGYQIEELDQLKETLRFKQYFKVMPEMAWEYVEQYIDLEKNDFKAFEKADIYSIGYYSHASWVRNNDKDADNNLNLHEGEAFTLELIRQFLQRQPKFKLIIFTHPRERHASIIDRTYQYYNAILQGSKFELAPFDLKSTLTFRKTNIGIIALSTILFERLYIGCKTLICKAGINGFPREQSKLQNVAFTSVDELEKLINENLDNTITHFYEKNDLKSYLFHDFNQRILNEA
jgi:hypothetical protein